MEMRQTLSRQGFLRLCLSMVLAETHGLVPLPHRVVESTDVELVTPLLVAHDPLVLVWVVESLHSGVALATLDPSRTGVPSSTTDQCLAVLWCILKQIWWSPEVPSMMGEDTTLGVMGVFLGWTPARLVVEHVEHISLFFVGKKLIQILLQMWKVK